MALLIEHYNGRWPLSLNPRQATILTLNDSAPVVEHARQVQQMLLGTTATGIEAGSPSGLAVEIDESARPLGTKVKQAKDEHHGVIVVVGPKDVASGSVTVDTTGIPATEGFVGKRNIQMKPEELLQYLKGQVNAYH